MDWITFLQPAIILAFLLAIAVQLLRGVKRSEPDSEGLRTYTFRPRWRRVLATAVVGAVLVPAMVITQAGHRGVIYGQSGGVDFTERQPGLSWAVPVYVPFYGQTPIMMNVRSQRYQLDLLAHSRDLQEIKVPLTVNYHVIPEQAAEIYDNIGRDYEQIIIEPAVFQAGTASIGQVDAVDFARERTSLAMDIHGTLGPQLGTYGIEVESVSVEDAVFDPAFIQAVKEKIIANEEAVEQQRLVVAATATADQAIERARGVAEAIRIEAEAQAQANDDIAASLTSDLLVWQRILQWDGVLPNTLLDGGELPLDLIFDTGGE